VVEQDYVRRAILQEQDRPDSANIGLIATRVRFCLDSGFDVLIEGILDSSRYGTMLSELTNDHRGVTGHFYLDVDFDETCRRHATRERAGEFDAERMRSWYRPHDLLGGIHQTLIRGETPAAVAAADISRRLRADGNNPPTRNSTVGVVHLRFLSCVAKSWLPGKRRRPRQKGR